MFQGLFKSAERSINSVVARFVGRATVAIPLLVAGGFATAALALKLMEMYGAVSAYTLMAVLFSVIGLIAMAINAKPHEAGAEASQAADTAGASDAEGEDSGAGIPPELMSVLTSVAPAAAPGIARSVGRNLPLIFILALVAFVVSRFAETSLTETDANAETDVDAEAQRAA